RISGTPPGLSAAMGGERGEGEHPGRGPNVERVFEAGRSVRTRIRMNTGTDTGEGGGSIHRRIYLSLHDGVAHLSPEGPSLERGPACLRAQRAPAHGPGSIVEDGQGPREALVDLPVAGGEITRQELAR